MPDTTDTETTESRIITSESLPAILVGGPPNSGKSVLTYNLTRELRRREVPHYVFRASPDGEGDWFLKGDLDTVRQIREKGKGDWSDIFRKLACQDLPYRQLPLIVDLGGRPKEKDRCIFQNCTHSILLLRDDEVEVSQTWRDYATANKLIPLAEIRSQLLGASSLTLQDSVVKGTLTGLVRGKHIDKSVFDILVDRVEQLFSLYTSEEDELERWHLSQAPQAVIVNLPKQLAKLAPDTDEWTPNMLKPFLAQLSEQKSRAVYGRGPAWLYAALALHGGTQPSLYQFDARLGWVTPPFLRPGTTEQSNQSVLPIGQPFVDDDTYVIDLYPRDNYLDYTEADQLVFPEPPVNRGVIVSGKLPLWLFTALSRFYAQRSVPWIALNDAHDNRAVVIYSKVATNPLGKRISMPV